MSVLANLVNSFVVKKKKKNLLEMITSHYGMEIAIAIEK